MLEPGDKIYLYTDGVNEAMNTRGEQFGNKRFREAANTYRSLPPQGFDEAIRREVAAFAEGAEQSDDITSVAISFLKRKDAPRDGIHFETERTVRATLGELEGLLDWIGETLKDAALPPKVRNHIAVVVEELFVNIASYAYPGGEGNAVIRLHHDDTRLALQFEDTGVAFDPLQQEAPDTKAGIEDRAVGGLGIFITRKWMDDLRYERLEGKNLVTAVKRLA
jgi:sigma-B regulation protein RsbU (phosphoserine phosphatase)